MKVVAFNGSPRINGNTSILINRVLDILKSENIETEYIQIGNKVISGCMACYKCFENKDKQCVIKTDIINECISKILNADGVILGSPTHFADITPALKALIDRAGFVSRANGDLFARKVGAAVIAVRRGGAIHAFDTINHFFSISQMIIVSSNYWNLGVGREIGAVNQDTEGLKTMEILANNFAWLLKKIKG